LSSYDSEKAQRRLLQMPVACIRLKNGIIVTEKGDATSYEVAISKISQIEEFSTVMGHFNKDLELNRNDCQDLLQSTSTTSEVQRIKHVLASTHNLSKRAAQRLGISNLKKRATQVENATETVKQIKSKHRYFSKIEQKAFLESQAVDPLLYLSSDSDSSLCDSEGDESADEVQPNISATISTESTETVKADTSHDQQTAGLKNYHCTSSNETDNTTAASLDDPEIEVHMPQQQRDNSEIQGHSHHKIIPDLDVNAVVVLDILKELDFNCFCCILRTKVSCSGLHTRRI